MSISPPPVKRRKLETPKAVSTAKPGLTVYAWNVNGIGPFVQQTITSFFAAPQKKPNGAAANSQLRQFLDKHSWPELLFLQEVKINPDDKATMKSVEAAVQCKQALEEPDYVARFCLPSDKFNARGFGRKIYGVCSIIRKDFFDTYVERVRQVDWDGEGRILVVETRQHDELPALAIYNIYAVNGTDLPYKDPTTGEIRGTRHDRKLAVHALLAAECRRLEAAGRQVILAGDMNIARTQIDGKPNLRTFPPQHCLNRADFESKFFSKSTRSTEGGLGMIDTFRMLHPEQEGFTYYPRTRKFGESCDRVDMIIASASLASSLTAAGMHETSQERGPSDHVPLYATFSFDRKEGHQA